MKSMTGYGKGLCEKDDKELTVEIKAVNNRFLEINNKLPKIFMAYDSLIRKEISSKIKRGSLDVLYSFNNKSQNDSSLEVDITLAKSYVSVAKKLRTEFILEDDFQLSSLMRSPDVIKQSIDKTDEDIKKHIVTEAVRQAVTELDKMRIQEGCALKNNLLEITENIVVNLKKLEERIPQINSEYAEKLKQRIAAVLDNINIDESKLANEIAFYADKSDINEEISRLKSHIEQLLMCINSGQEQGRKLDFLSQEMLREANTIGSKTGDLININTVLEIKNEIEKLKEQIRNIE